MLAIPPYLFKINSGIILSSTPRSTSLYLPFNFSDQTLVCISELSHACYVTSFLMITLIMFGEAYKLLSSSSCRVLQPAATYFPLGPNIHLSTWRSNTLTLCSFLRETDQVSYPYKTRGRIIDIF